MYLNSPATGSISPQRFSKVASTNTDRDKAWKVPEFLETMTAIPDSIDIFLAEVPAGPIV
jgi:hypothetical protein